MPNSSSLLTLCTFWSLNSYRVVVNDVSAKEERTMSERKGRPKWVKGCRRREMVNLELRERESGSVSGLRETGRRGRACRGRWKGKRVEEDDVKVEVRRPGCLAPGSVQFPA